MMVEAIPDAQLDDLVECLGAIRHDLGKYMAFELRFVGLDAPSEALRRALNTDLLATMRRRTEDGGEIVESAWVLWRRLRPEALSDDPDVRSIDRAMSVLETSDLDASGTTLRQTAELALAVSTTTRRLSDRARARVQERVDG